mmetsp:Transcript_27189/g.50983  ORF Transcript_27189/g.50983 Transcript_27189/m.50983 type:complete len:191 (-) Transcript_27189:113-685(-)
MKIISILLMCYLALGSSGFLFTPIREKLKSEILQLATETRRGLTATPDQQRKIKETFERLEKLNPTAKPLQSDKVNGVWDLQYTTSESILGKGGFPRIGPIQQMIDTKTLTAYNSEVVDYFGLKIPRKIEAELIPRTDCYTNVQFKKFLIGPLGFDAPEQFKGALDITYLDDDLRLTRGDKGNLFVLTRQ